MSARADDTQSADGVLRSLGQFTGMSANHMIEAIEAIDPPIPMMILKRGMVIRWISGEAIRELGLTADALVGRCWYDLFPDSRQRKAEHDRLFSGALSLLDVPRMTLRGTCGKPRYFSLRVRPISSPDGTVEALLGLGEETTAQVDAERALRDSEERFRAISYHSRDLIVVSSREGLVLYASAAIERVLGRRMDERVGASIFDFMHPDDLSQARTAFERVIASPLDGALETLVVRKRSENGSWRYLEFTATNLLDHPQVRGVVLNGRDVTERKQAESALAESEARLETSLWSSKAAYWTIDVPADRATMSPQFFDLTGIDPEAWARDRNPWNSRMHPEDLPAARRAYEDYVSGRVGFYECEYRLQTPGGWLWMHDRGRVTDYDGDGRALRIAGTTQDASARKALERALAEASRTEQRRLSYDLHDGLGQELSGIQFMLAGLVKRLRQDRSAHADEVEQTLALVRQSLATTRAIAHGLAPASLKTGGLRVALQQLARDMSSSHGIRVQCVSNDWNAMSVPEMAAENLFRMCQEALTNALRHGAATEITLAISHEDGELELSITDNGSGIPTRLPERRGMGLRIMAYRAQSIGARLSIGRALARGTRIVIRYPISGHPAGDLRRG